MAIHHKTNAASRSRNMKSLFLNALFIVFSVALLFFLLRAPEETTAFLPHDEIHNHFHSIKSKKDAEKTCLQCHGAGMETPLPADHPLNANRCLFCHKRK